MSIDVEYAIKKDIRNNPIFRELDTQQRREFRRIVLLAAFSVGLVLFSAWQHFETRRHGMSIEELRQALEHEQVVNRQLRLNLESFRAPQYLETRARRELGLVTPALAETIVIERTRASTPASTLVASAR
jgi:hypothetical protein